jgi:butyrate kinase
MKSADPRILTINGGSSSIKFALYHVEDKAHLPPDSFSASNALLKAYWGEHPIVKPPTSAQIKC